MPVGEDWGKAQHCMGYLSGVTDTLSMLKSLKQLNPSAATVCLPVDGITMLESAKVVVKFLNDNPNSLHMSYRMLVLVAFTQAYPCHK
jgi:hypothetical protein